MANAMKCLMIAAVKGLIAAALLAAPLSCLAGSDALFDPTTPPMAMMPGGDGGLAEPAGPVLQSVLLSPGRKIAVISGQSVRVGGKFGDATLIKVSDHEAVLRNGDGTLQTLKMYPAVEKRVIVKPQRSPSRTHKTKRPVHQTAPNIR